LELFKAAQIEEPKKITTEKPTVVIASDRELAAKFLHEEQEAEKRKKMYSASNDALTAKLLIEEEEAARKKKRDEAARLDEILAKELWDREQDEEEARKKKKRMGRYARFNKK